MKRVLIADGMDPQKIEELIDRGFEIIDERVDSEELLDAVKEVDALVVRSRTKVNKNVVDAAAETGRLKVIIRAGIGLDNIDLEACSNAGIEVYNTPNSSANAVAELALGQMISISRNVDLANIEMKKGLWNKEKYMGVELSGKTLGLIGYGRIACELAKKASALGMNVIFTSRSDKKCEEFKQVDLNQLLSESDYISVHIPGGKANHYFINEPEFNKMKDGVYLIDLARGGIVCERALIEALNSGKVRAAAVDVFECEPSDNTELLCHPKVSVTPHIGASTYEAQKNIGTEVVERLVDRLYG